MVDKVAAVRIQTMARALSTKPLAPWIVEHCMAGVCGKFPHILRCHPVPTQRYADAMMSGVLISSSGGGKSHVPRAVVDVACAVLQWPRSLRHSDSGVPIHCRSKNMSALAEAATQFGHLAYWPDHVVKALLSQRRHPLCGKPSGTSKALQISFTELIDLTFPVEGGGGSGGVRVDRSMDHTNSFGSTITKDKMKYQLVKDGGGASFRFVNA